MQSYSKYAAVEQTAAVTQAHANLTNTITDRVAVNHCVVKELEETFGHALTELNCNVHPLDGIVN